MKKRAGAILSAIAVVVLCEWYTCHAESFVNFESGHVRPLALSPTAQLLFAVNTPDNRLEVFFVHAEGLEHVGEVVTGLEPVAVFARTDSQVFVVNHLSDSVSVVDTSDPERPFVAATLLVGDEPRDVVVAGPERDKIFVTTAHRGQNNPRGPELYRAGVDRADVWVFDGDEPTRPPHVLTLFCDTPRALAVGPDGNRVYVAAFRSGNRTTTLNRVAVEGKREFDSLLNDGFTAHGPPPPLSSHDGTPAPPTGLIVSYDGERWYDDVGRDWSARVRFDLPDRDVFVIDASRPPPHRDRLLLQHRYRPLQHGGKSHQRPGLRERHRRAEPTSLHAQAARPSLREPDHDCRA